MKKYLFVCLILLLFSMASVNSAELSKNAIKARDMVKKAIEYWKKNGKEAAIKEFCNTKGQFVDGEYYIFAHDFSLADKKCLNIARADGNTSLIGQNLWPLKDPDGVYYFQEFVKVATKDGFGWVDYKRTNPVSKKIEPKSSYIEVIPGTTIVVGCGFYK